MTWNPHKSMGVPHQCSCFVTKHQHMLAECNSTEAGYLFQKDTKTYDSSLDTGDKSIQCGRLADVFKLWLMWKHEVRMHNYGSYNFLFRCRRCYCLSYPCTTFVVHVYNYVRVFGILVIHMHALLFIFLVMIPRKTACIIVDKKLIIALLTGDAGYGEENRLLHGS